MSCPRAAPSQRMSCPSTMPANPRAHSRLLDILRQSHGIGSAVASETTSRPLARPSKSGRASTYLKKCGATVMREMNPIQKRMVAVTTISHGQLPFIAPNVARTDGALDCTTVSLRLRNAIRKSATEKAAKMGTVRAKPVRSFP